MVSHHSFLKRNKRKDLYMEMENRKTWVRQLDRCLGYIYQVVEIFNKIIFLVMVSSISTAVFGRFILKKTPKWSEEVGILCLVWLCFLTAQLAIRDGNHIRMTIIEYMIPKRAAKILHMSAYAIILIINVLWVIYGAQVVALTLNTSMASTGLPMAFIYASTVVSGAVGIFMVIGRMIRGNW